MERTNTYHIWPRDLDFVSCFRAIWSFAEKRGMTLDDTEFVNFTVTFNPYESATTESYDEFLNLLKQTRKFDHILSHFRFSTSENQPRITFNIDCRKSSISIAINGTHDDSIIAAHDFIKREWRLSNPPILAAEIGRPQNLQATIFLGKHFDEEAKKPAQILHDYLRLLRFDVREAEEYRALPIPEKVQTLIVSQDIYLGLVTGKREHDWLIAEAGFAAGRNKHVIMVVEEDSGFNPTIQGRDYERVQFPRNFIEKSFIPLLQEFKSLGIGGLG